MQKIYILLLLLGLNGYSQFKDYSQNEGFTILQGILLKSQSIIKLADSTTTFFNGNPIIVQKFKMKSEINVQVECNGVEGKFEKAKANYIIEIGNDTSTKIKKMFAQEIYKYWMEKDESYLNGYKYLEAAKHIFYLKGDYVMYIDPQNNNIGNYYLLYYKDKIIKVTFTSFDQNGGAGGLSAFLSELAKFKFKNRTLKTDYKSEFAPKKFFRLYESKLFDK